MRGRSLHNEDEIKRLDIKIGDTVLIEKSGEIIPQVLQVVASKRDGSETEYEFPTVCPVCGLDAVRPEGEADSPVFEPDCPAKVKARIGISRREGRWISRGSATFWSRRLSTNGMVKDVADLYTLQRSDICES